MDRKVAIVGASEAGLEVLNQLERYRISASIYDDLERSGNGEFPAIDVTSDDALREIGISKDIDLLFVMFDDMAKNVFVCLSAHAMDSELVIISVADSQDTEQKLIAAGATKIIDPYSISARKLNMMLKRQAASDVLHEVLFGIDHDLEMAQILISEDSDLVGTYCDVRAIEDEYGLIILGVTNQQKGSDFSFMISGNSYRYNYQDALIVIGPVDKVKAFNKVLGACRV